jgi:mannitol-1-phosphate/altronate dehydrogenase
MTNPFLHDDVDRIIRDPKRKLGWSDRLFGTMRAALEAGIEPKAMALGAAAATACSLEQDGFAVSRDGFAVSRDGFAISRSKSGATTAREHLLALWGSDATGGEREACLSLVQDAMSRLDAWRA